MLIKSDKYFKENLTNILKNGYRDENPRPKYESDNAPAHTIALNQIVESYDLNKNEFPFSLARPIAVKTGIKEILAIYQGQLNTRESFEEYGVTWWKSWFKEDGTLGTSYPYNLESGRSNEVIRQIVTLKPKLIDEKYKELKDIPVNRTEYNIGYLDGYEEISYFNKEEKEKLLHCWRYLLKRSIESNEYFMHQDWHSFKQFLLDLPYIPQFHLAKENNFKNWRLTNFYYKSNCISKDTVVFLSEEDISKYSFSNEFKLNEDGSFKRYELSRNQLNDLIHNLKVDKYSRHNMISLWNWQTITRKALWECAYETLWSCRNENGEVYLDMTLIQRSNDVAVAGHINKLQYSVFLLMIANQCGYKPGKFVHFVQNFHIYDRHIEQVKEILRRLDELENTNCIQPKIVLKGNKDFYNITIDDFEIIDYYPYQGEKLTFELGI